MPGTVVAWKVDDPGESLDSLELAIDRAVVRLWSCQRNDGHWAFELEADATIPAEYIMLNHYLGEVNEALEAKLAVYLRNIQSEHGGWPLFHDGDFNMSASVKAYLALKLVGDDPDAPHMERARNTILKHGGAVNANVFTRFSLALFGLMPWHATPVSRVEVLLAPGWFPFHIGKVSYWSRTVMVPLLVLAALRPRAKNPRGVTIDELFLRPPAEEHYRLKNPTGRWPGAVFIALDRLAQPLQHLIPRFLTRMAIAEAVRFIDERLNGEDGLGGIFPAMANALMVYNALGIPKDDPRVRSTRGALDALIVEKNGYAYCQPCLSPVWDTGLAMHALLEAGVDPDDTQLAAASRWLTDRQILDSGGDWQWRREGLRPGGWAFQYRNDHYPDVDDTAVVTMALHRRMRGETAHSIQRATEWILGMQSANGGWGSFDADNEHYLLNHIPFADHGALLDPPTADVTARCLGMLGQLGFDRDHPAVAAAIEFLKREQEADGSWFGRWGTNYIYGTWSVLTALNVAGEDMDAPYVRKAVKWLEGMQRDDGGWGEDCRSYWPNGKVQAGAALPSQTAWALMALMAAGEVNSEAVRRGVQYLMTTERNDGGWDEEHYNAVGFPRVFFLKYHGYSEYFPLWALARYKNLVHKNTDRPEYGL